VLSRLSFGDPRSAIDTTRDVPERIAEIELLENGGAEIVTGSGRRVPVSRRHLREMKDRLLIT